MYRATPNLYSFGNGTDLGWVVQQEICCINGLHAWFTICNVAPADIAELGYTEGYFGKAEERAKKIADALNASK